MANISNVVITGGGGISITPKGLKVPVPGTKAVIEYDAKTRILSITGLSGQDRIVTSQVMLDSKPEEHYQAVSIEFK